MKWLKEQLEYLRQNYEQGNLVEMAPILGRSMKSVSYMARKMGLRNKAGYYNRALNSKSIDVHFFDTWSSNMAYILGLLFADGWVTYSKTSSFSIKIRKSDREILEKVRGKLKSIHKISDRYQKGHFIKSGINKGHYISGGWSSGISFTNKYMVEVLMGLGLVPAKSLHENFPLIPMQYLFDFLRGYWDGDGSISWGDQMKCSKCYLEVSFCGAENTVLNIKKMLGGYVKGGSICKNGSIKSLVYGKKDGQVILNKFYDTDPDLYLQRKYDRYMGFLKEENLLKAA